jgi:hypothetical protein
MSFLSNILQYVEKANLLPPGIKTLIEEVLHTAESVPEA